MPKPDGKINLEKFYEKYTARDNRFIHKSNKKYKTAIEDDNFNTNNNVKKFAKNQKINISKNNLNYLKIL